MQSWDSGIDEVKTIAGAEKQKGCSNQPCPNLYKPGVTALTVRIFFGVKVNLSKDHNGSGYSVAQYFCMCSL